MASSHDPSGAETRIGLPEIVARYVAAQNRHDIDAMLACFAPDARVHDEGKAMAGVNAVRAWIGETSAKYRVALAPQSCERDSGGATMVAKVTGTFPGSPIDLTYRFGFSADGRIASLEIG
jgi:hypothetical protein